MKPAIFFFALLVAALPTAAFSQQVSCKDLGDIAADIMEFRQQEVPLSRVMETAGGDKALEQLILAAYERSAFSTKEYRESAIAEFRNDIELMCYRARQ